MAGQGCDARMMWKSQRFSRKRLKSMHLLPRTLGADTVVSQVTRDAASVVLYITISTFVLYITIGTVVLHITLDTDTRRCCVRCHTRHRCCCVTCHASDFVTFMLCDTAHWVALWLLFWFCVKKHSQHNDRSSLWQYCVISV